MDTHYIWAAFAQNGIASLKIYTSYVIDGQVLFRIVTPYAFITYSTVLMEFASINTRKSRASIREKLLHCLHVTRFVYIQ